MRLKPIENPSFHKHLVKFDKKYIDSVAKSLEEVKEMGGDTILVVPAVVNEKISHEQAYITSQQAIRELIPSAKKNRDANCPGERLGQFSYKPC